MSANDCDRSPYRVEYRGHVIRPAVYDRLAGNTFYPRVIIKGDDGSLDTTLGWPTGCESREEAENRAIGLAKQVIDHRLN